MHLSFWSANEAYWAIRFEHSAATPEGAAPSAPGGGGGDDEALRADAAADPPRTLVVYKETQACV